ncbi:protochlorophyllide reductase [Herbihabitans rhizosphaerae]|uniref:Protochlorophyllide reductase n=1 Tax=Herbihabitans rhizosphaerae TaxID=1872711 RepID=A0A4Q7KQY3_9PSEU|nr:oxidoreductase [Herbihabitans rhizosphaerae]RZS38847.1 protochlorophyllide reductase [Herbihabitans rhizosphaerae]
MTRWSEADIPDQTGKTVLITGANSGLGLRSAIVLAGKGAKVLLACRSPERGEDAVHQVRDIGGEAELIQLDLADLSSVRAAAAEVRDKTGDTLHVLMNNAGVMATPNRKTADGFELQLGTNHLGHAALTWLLAPALRATPGARVVTLSSVAHRGGGLDVDDLNFERRRYTSGSAYSQSKMANLLFAFELDRRARAAELDLASIAAHPGVTDTELAANSMRSRGTGMVNNVLTMAFDFGYKVVSQSVKRGALPQLYAATVADVRGGDFIGPTGPGEFFGTPGHVKARRAATSTELAGTLWDRTAELTGITPDPA